MKRYRCYLRTILLSVLAALVIDAIINFEDYKQGWQAGLQQEPKNTVASGNFSNAIGKLTGITVYLILRN